MSDWKRREIEIEKSQLLSLSKKYNINLLTTVLLLRREVREEEFIFFLENNFNLSETPFSLLNINKFIKRIYKAIEEGENIMIFGDKDVDGITATVIMYETLKDFGLNLCYKIPKNGEFYGLSNDVIDEARERDISLIITVDCGTSNNKEIEYALSKGIEVIITDHHLPSKEQVYDGIIINPHLKEDKSPFKEIAGCAVSFKVGAALYLSKTSLYNKDINFIFVEKSESNSSLELCVVNIYQYIMKKTLKLSSRDDKFKNLTALFEFSKDKYIVLFNKSEQLSLIKEFFKEDLALDVIDIAEEFYKKYPKLNNKSLREILKISKYLKYKNFNIENKLYYIFYNLILESNNLILEKILNKIDLVAIGTVADNMPLLNENRILVREGLKRIDKSKRVSINVLLKDLNLLNANVGSYDIAWKIAPLLNSTGRLERADLALEFLLSEDFKDAEEKFKKIKALNQERRKKESEAWLNIRENIIINEENILICYDREVSKGICSILATKLAKKHNKVVIYISKQDEILKGSIRSIDKINSKKLINQISSSIIINSGGHNGAAGFTIHERDLEMFLKEIVPAFNNMKQNSIEEEIFVDALIPKDFKKEELYKTIELLEPFGREFENFIFQMNNVYVNYLRTIDKNGKSAHMSLNLELNNNKYRALYFNGTQKIEELNIKAGNRINIIFNIINGFQKNGEKQLSIIDIKKA